MYNVPSSQIRNIKLIAFILAAQAGIVKPGRKPRKPVSSGRGYFIIVFMLSRKDGLVDIR